MKKDMRVIDADKLKKHIEDATKEIQYTPELVYKAKGWERTYDTARYDTYQEILEFVDRLERERFVINRELPTSQELDDAAIAYSKRVSDGRMYRDLLAGFIAGAEWMAEQIKEDKQ